MWVECEDFPGYWVNEIGEVASTRGRQWRLRKITLNRYANVCVGLGRKGQIANPMVHRLVAKAFCLNPDPATHTQVNHIDGDKHNNHFSNLEWTTPGGNVRHAVRTGLAPPPVPRYGTDNHLFTLTHSQVEQVLEHHSKGMSQRKIAQLLGINRGPVRASLRAAQIQVEK